MTKQIITDTFETLGQTAKQTAGQVVQEPQKMAEAAGKQMIGGQPTPEEQATGGQAVGPVQKAMNKRASQSRLDWLQKELAALRQKKAQEQQAVQTQTEQQKQVVKQLELEKKKQKTPLVVQQAKAKAGTKERKLMGVSG